MCQWYNIAAVMSPGDLAANDQPLMDGEQDEILLETPPNENDVLHTSSDEEAVLPESEPSEVDLNPQPPKKRKYSSTTRAKPRSLEVLGFPVFWQVFCQFCSLY